MKKTVAMLLAAIALFSLAACGSTASPDVPASAETPTATAEPTAEPQPEEISESTYYGTWKIVSCEQNGITATAEALEKSGGVDLSNTGLVLCEDGTGCLYMNEDRRTFKWVVAEGGIYVDSNFLPVINDQIVLTLDNKTVIHWEKASDDQTIPEPSAEPSPEPAAEDGLRPEFKDAMDSYEAFYNEYCEVLKKYMANPSDLSILGKYMDLMGKLSDMDAKFEAWESEDLNAEELKYYMDVNNRVMKKLLDITG